MTAVVSRELSALSRAFSPAVIRDLGSHGTSSLLARLLRESRLADALPKDATLAQAYDAGFATLSKPGNRDDYVYRSAIMQKIAWGRHNVRTATPLSEFRAGVSKADLVILNGTSTAYEIKSERDSLQRLPQQLNDYRRVFASVYVATSPEQADAVLDLAPSDVGIMVLSKRFNFSMVREAADKPERTEPLAILSSLRVQEATQVLVNLGVEVPLIPNTQRWSFLSRAFEGLDPIDTHEQFVEVLKVSRRDSTAQLSGRAIPPSLRTAVHTAKPSTTARVRIAAALSQPLSSVMDWK